LKAENKQPAFYRSAKSNEYMVSSNQPTQQYPPSNQHRNESFSLPHILYLLQRYWYLFIISLPISLAIVFFMHLYSHPIYQASCTLLLKSEEKSAITSTDLINGIGLSPETRSIENQTFIIKSYKIIYRAIRQLDFDIEYYTEDNFIDTEIYQTAPFKVIIDSGIPQLLDVPIHISAIGNDKLKVKISTEEGSLYSYDTHQYMGNTGAIQLEKEIKWGEPVITPAGAFSIEKSENGELSEGNAYHIKFRSPEDVANQYRSTLSISSYSEGSSIMFLQQTGKTPAKLRRFLDELCQVIVEYNLDQKNEIANRSLGFIHEQLNTIADTLERTQTVLLNFRKENRFTAPSAASERVADELFETEKQKKFLGLKSDYFKMLKEKLQTNPQSTDFMLPAFSEKTYPLVTQLITQLITTNSEIGSFTQQENTINPYINTLKSKSEDIRNNLMQSIDKILENLQIEQQAINQDISIYENELNNLPELEKRFLQIERTYKLNDAIYTFLLQKNSETQITKASNTPDNEIIDQASINGMISPNKKNNYTKALIIGLLLPVGIVFLLEMLNFKIRNKQELVFAIGSTPVVGVLPHSKYDGSNVICNMPHSVISESFRSIRTSINFMTPNGAPKVISITSTNTGDGKTFVSLNLASAFAVSGKKTIILGFDLRKPKLSTLFNLANKPGISNFLVGQSSIEDICYPTGQQNLCIMPSGEIPPNPSELIGSETTATLFQWLRDHFDIIIVDTPPIGIVADARLLMSKTDAMLYIVRYNYTRKDHLIHTIENLHQDDIHSMGVVFNDVPNSSGVYGNYHSKYYGKEEIL
jgi:capsular exopolysaccharide synthesis family protein